MRKNPEKQEPVALDSPRLAAIRAAVREGRFRVNPEVVADRLIAQARERLRSPSIADGQR